MKFPVTFLLFLIVAASAISAGAATLEQYKTQLEELRTEVEIAIDDISLVDEDEGVAGDLTESIARIRATIPQNQRVDMPGGPVQLDFGWLSKSLDELANAKDFYEKNAALESIRDRLAAIDSRIAELETAIEADKSKDQYKQKLAEIMQRPEFQKPAEPEESLFAKWWRAIREWLESLLPEQSVQAPSGGMPNLAAVFQILLFVGIAALIAFLIWRFYPAIAQRFGLLRDERRGKRVILGEQIAEDVSAADLLSEAERLARDGELRLAVRKGYIALLCDLADRRVIALAHHKTNRDYLRDVKKRSGLLEAMTGATTRFEHSWYGAGEVDNSDWEAFRAAYLQTLAEAKEA